MSLRRLGLDRIDLYYLHRVDPQVSFEDQLGVLNAMQTEGKIRHIGLSKVTLGQIDTAQRLVTVAAVQNRYNVDEGDRQVLDCCSQTHTAFVPYAPLAAGELPHRAEPGDARTAAKNALSWLLNLSPVVLPIPATTSIDHLEDNLSAAEAHQALHWAEHEP